MNHIFNNIRMLDDKTIIENIEQFKLMLEAQNLYSYQSQCDLDNLNQNYNKKKVWVLQRLILVELVILMCNTVTVYFFAY